MNALVWARRENKALHCEGQYPVRYLMLEDEDSNLFEGISADEMTSGSVATEEGDGFELLTDRQLRAMDHESLVAHTSGLQDLYSQLENENRFLAWEFQEFQDNVSYFSRAVKLAHKLSASDLETIAALAINEVPDYFGCRFAALFLFEPSTKLFKLYRSSLPPPQEIRPLHSDRDADNFLVQFFTAHKEPFIVEHLKSGHMLLIDSNQKMETDVPEAWVKALGKKAIVFPLRVNASENASSVLLGGLIIGAATKELVAKDADVSIIFGDLLASSLYNAILVKRLNEMTSIDPLTQIYNRRHLINNLTSAMTHARRQGHKLAVAMLDLDHFKDLNDEHGHLCGDEVLKGVAAILKESVRMEVDIAARYGGEEFILVMPYTSLEQGIDVAERVRKRIDERTFLCAERGLTVTCSIGVAEYRAGESLEKFVDRADEALYQAKHSGRDRVCAAVK